MKTQKKAHQVSVRVVILLAMLCILTFFVVPQFMCMRHRLVQNQI